MNIKYLFFLILFSCSTVNQKLTTDIVYKKDVAFTANNKKIAGMGIIPKAPNYEILIEYKSGNIDLLTLTSCHRQVILEKQGSKVNYTYTPSKVELDTSCPLDIGIYDQKGRHGWGFLGFTRSENKLIAKVECNGESGELEGVSLCQGNIGTIQRLTFSTNIKAIASQGCSFSQRENIIEYQMKKDFCYFSFVDDKNNFHDHTSFGYETFIIRGE
jgi:hypothetical protein